MSGLNAIAKFFALPDDPDLVQAQARAFTRQVPLMYCILLVNSLALAATHDTAPALLRIYVPALLTLACMSRLVMWWRTRKREMTAERARKLLGSTVALAALLGVGFSAWSLSLYPYGNAFQQSHVAFYMAITSICCVFSLKNLRGAAITVAVCVLVPFTGVFATSGNAVFMALAFNFAIVVLVLIWLLLGNYRDFSELVASRSAVERKQRETQLLSDENYRMANVDSLTGLPNRRWFVRHLTAELEKAEAEGRQIAVARLDLDSFKSVNDIFGQITGDRVLIEVAERIKALRRPATMVARLGDDEFALVIVEATSSAGLQSCGDTLAGAMRKSFDTKQGIVHLSASAGLALSKSGDTAETLYDRADYATWVAKREARGTALVFSDKHAAELGRVRIMEHALLTADLEAEIHILFQPQFDVSLNRITGFEVLARWHNPLLGEVSPAKFIPLAERIGMISKITQTVLRKALLASARLPRSMRLSVNLSAHDLASTTAIEAIVALVQQAGRPCRVDFEITETAVMRDMEQASDALIALLSLGSRIALDDFGTGHSSLTYVQKLPLDRIKVDRSFVKDVTTDATSRAIIKTTIDLCRNLGISCVFEGIETEEQLKVLLGLGGTVMQGYLFGRPMTEDAMLKQLTDERHGWHRHPRQVFDTAS
ncbi:MAG TPA: EAL domain-containing protein [Devosia sp.]|jgi:diguanylate cyclase (GGDEF)-like protein|uniref:putative bifunctional diguanylate cyclase/phosphodiesterase n=1 Tax=Devosia sp. TaxID=1871048 RepID=UPI002F931D1B